MVCYRTLISFCESIDKSDIIMLNSHNFTDPYAKSRQSSNNLSRNKKTPNSPKKIPVCDRCQYAIIDVVLLIAVLGACGFLIYPYFKLVMVNSIGLFGEVMTVMKEEDSWAPVMYGSLGLGVLFAGIAASVILMCTNQKCGNPNCKGFRKAAEFDIQLEEECVKNSSPTAKDGIKKGLFELPRDHHRELEAELKKMAPPNGRAVLVFRARCGCSAGRLEVPGPKKLRNIKKP